MTPRAPWLALVLCSLTGCKHENTQVSTALVEVLSTDTTAASTVCGYTVSSLGNVQVIALDTHGTEASGTGTARVTGNPVGYTERASPGACTANVSFQYATATARRRMMISQNGTQRRIEDQVIRITNLAVSAR